MFEKGAIRTGSGAKTFIKLIQDNKMKEFDERMTKLDKAVNAKQPKEEQKRSPKNRTIRYNNGEHQNTSLK
jgi:hypothetical protein